MSENVKFILIYRMIALNNIFVWETFCWLIDVEAFKKNILFNDSACSKI